MLQSLEHTRLSGENLLAMRRYPEAVTATDVCDLAFVPKHLTIHPHDLKIYHQSVKRWMRLTCIPLKIGQNG